MSFTRATNFAKFARKTFPPDERMMRTDEGANLKKRTDKSLVILEPRSSPFCYAPFYSLLFLSLIIRLPRRRVIHLRARTIC